MEIKTSEGCPYGCSFCFNGKNEFKEYDLPEITSNKVILLDDAFLSRKNVLRDIKELGSKKVNNKVVYYELLQGINLHDLTQDIAFALKESRFINIRFAWDDSYCSKSMFRLFDGINMLKNAGYKPKTMMCFILSNYYVPYEECISKLNLLNRWGIKVCNCVYRKNYLDPKIYPEQWSIKDIKKFRTQRCRKINQLINFGIDPELKNGKLQTKPKKR